MATCDQVGFLILRSAYQNLWKTMAATGVTWISKPLLDRVGLNVGHTMTFVITASLIHYALVPFFLESEFSGESLIPKLLRRAGALIVLTKVIADQQKLNIPFVQTYAKTAVWACIAIGGIQLLSRFIESR